MARRRSTRGVVDSHPQAQCARNLCPEAVTSASRWTRRGAELADGDRVRFLTPRSGPVIMPSTCGELGELSGLGCPAEAPDVARSTPWRRPCWDLTDLTRASPGLLIVAP